MRVKKYVVDTLPDAVALIRQELGNDAIIINSKEIKVGGFLGLFRKKKVEVFAAIETAVSKPAPQQRKTGPSTDVDMAVEQVLQMANRNGIPIKAPEAPAQPAVQSFAAANSEREQFILDEIRELKAHMVKMTKQQRDYAELSSELLMLKERLIDQEVAEEHIDELVHSIHEQQLNEKKAFSKQEVWELAGSRLKERLLPHIAEELNSEARVIGFVGPTGVGKTTTIAKLAAEQALKKGRKVGFITSDTYRIAAVDQLRTYANILNIPIEIVFSSMDLTKAYKNLSDKELIYFDTAGRNFKNELHVSEVNSLLQSNEAAEMLLVLSMTSKSKDMAAVAEQFSGYGVRKVLFTKLDETTSVGAILNTVLAFNLKVTYITSGQNVPDDIKKFNVNTYIQSLLGDAGDE